jgi:hypothetical protein
MVQSERRQSRSAVQDDARRLFRTIILAGVPAQPIDELEFVENRKLDFFGVLDNSIEIRNATTNDSI